MEIGDHMLKELQDEKARISSQIGEIEKQRRNERNVALIGKCFQYRNSLGSSTEDWWLYAKIIRAEDGNLIAHRFQTDCHGRMEVDPEHTIWDDLSAGYEEIPSEDFNAAWAGLKAAIECIK